MTEAVLVPEILERLHTEALLPKETDRRLQDLIVAWDGLTGMGGSAYVAWLKARLEKRESAPSTVARKIASVSAFFKYCVGEHELSRNPLAKVKRPRVPKQPKSEFLADDEVIKLKELISAERSAAEQGNLLALIRAARCNEVIFVVMLGTGCRISELLALRLWDVETRGDQGRLHFRTKGSEDNIVAVPLGLVESAIEFAQFVGIHSATEIAFFLFKNTKESAEKRIGQDLMRLCKAVGIGKDVTTQALRATVATSLHEKGVTIVQIQRLLNHTDISTPVVYMRKLNTTDAVVNNC